MFEYILMIFITYSMILTFIIFTDLDTELTLKQLVQGSMLAALVWPATWLWTSPSLFKLLILLPMDLYRYLKPRVMATRNK